MILLEESAPSSRSMPAAPLEPWSAPPKASLRQLQSVVRCDAFLLAVGSPERLQSDEVLATSGLPGDNVADLLDDRAGIATVTAAFEHQGVRSFARGEKGSPRGVNDQHSVVAAVMEPHEQPRVWRLLLSRKRTAFSEQECELALIQLRRWQCEFVAPREAGLSRVVLGHDQRLILTDLSMRERLQRDPTCHESLLVNLNLVLEQRVPRLKEGQPHDFVASIGASDLWVTFQRQRPYLGATQWYLELRPSAEDELPAVGLIDDERIASAVAFMHDHYAETPSLVQVANHVHMSPFHFHRLFAKIIGVTPKQYMLRRQMQMSKWLLRARRVPISAIASLAGFSSHGHFTSTFHRLIGVSPREYRETHASA